MSVLSWLAPLSSWLVMLHLGAQSTQAHAAARPGLGLLAAHYALPLLTVLLLYWLELLDVPQSLGLAVCVLAGTGTSAVPWALREGASGGAISHRLAVGAVVALICLPLTALAYATPDAALQRFVLTALIMAGAMWLPWLLGRRLARRQLSAAAASLLGRAATLSVLALILLIAWRELPRLPEQPALLAACVLLVLVQGTGGAVLDAATGLATTAVIRNLTLATVVLMVGDHAGTAMTALAAFGVVMYLGVWPTSLLARHWRQQRAHNKAACADAEPPAM